MAFSGYGFLYFVNIYIMQFSLRFRRGCYVAVGYQDTHS